MTGVAGGFRRLPELRLELPELRLELPALRLELPALRLELPALRLELAGEPELRDGVGRLLGVRVVLRRSLTES